MAQSYEIELLKQESILHSQLSSQSIGLDIQSCVELQLQQKIKVLELKLEKKSQLVKYLQKKCGNQIIVASRKLQDKIKKLQLQNGNLKKCVESFGMHNDRKSYILSQISCLDNSNLDTTFSNISSQFQYLKKGKLKNLNELKQDLTFLNEEQLREIVLMQALEIKHICKQNQSSSSFVAKGKAKQKKLAHSASKKNSLVLSLTQTSLRDCNQNKNKSNISSALKQTTNVSLIVPLTSNEFNKKSSPNLFSKTNPHLQCIEAPTQTDSYPTSKQHEQAETQTIWNQLTQSLQFKQTICQTQTVGQYSKIIQTELSSQDLEYLYNCIRMLKKENQKLIEENVDVCRENIMVKKEIQQTRRLNQDVKKYCYEVRKQIQTVNLENASLKQEILFFSQKIQDCCEQFEKQQPQLIQPEVLRSKQSKRTQMNVALFQNYKQILQVFGIQPFKDPTSLTYSHQQQIHKLLINQICGMKHQISHIIRQFKKMEKQLNDAFMHRNHFEQQSKWQEDRIQQIEDSMNKLNQLLQLANEEIMLLRNRDMHWKLSRKYANFAEDEEQGNCLGNRRQLKAKISEITSESNNDIIDNRNDVSIELELENYEIVEL